MTTDQINWAVSLERTSASSMPQLSFLDRLAAPTVFLELALVFEEALHPGQLQAAVAAAVVAYPGLAGRLQQNPDGQLQIVASSHSGSAGVAFLQASAPNHLSLQQLIGCDMLQSATEPPLSPQNPRTASMQALSGDDAGGRASLAITSGADNSSSGASVRARQCQCPPLPHMLFAHLPGALLPDYANSDLPLVHVALLQLCGGGCVLGLRLSHLLGDWTSMRLLLRCICQSYSSLRVQQLQQPPERPVMHAAAPLLDKVLSAAWQQQQKRQQAGEATGPFVPLRLKLMQPDDRQRFKRLAALASSKSSGDSTAAADSCSHDGSVGNSSNGSTVGSNLVRLSYHVPPGKAEQLKQHLQAAAASSGGTAAAGPLPCSSHTAVLAAAVAAFTSLPDRVQLPHDVSIAVDMRGRLPERVLLPPELQQQLPLAFGNLFASAIVEDWQHQQGSSSSSSLVPLTHALQDAVLRASQLWAPDHAWAASVLGELVPKHSQLCGTAGDAAAAADAATPTPKPPAGSGDAAGSCPDAATDVAGSAGGGGSSSSSEQREVTWSRLHAMGPTALLQQQMDLGLLASLSTTQWPLDFAADACMDGQLPALSLPGFSQPQPYPLVITQQATLCQGGGWMVHFFADATEAAALQQSAESMLC